MIGIAALAIGIVLGLVFTRGAEVVQPYLPIAVVAALDAVFGGLRAYLERIFDPKVFVISFVFNVFVAALIVYVGDQLGWARSCPRRSSWCWASASSAMPPRCGAGCSGRDRDGASMSQDPPDGAAESREAASRAQHGRHELPTNSPARRSGRYAGRDFPGWSVAAGPAWRSGRWRSCCVCCWASPSSRRSARTSRATRWKPRARGLVGAAGFVTAAGGHPQRRSERIAENAEFASGVR